MRRLSQLPQHDRERALRSINASDDDRGPPLRVLDIVVHETEREWRPTGILLPDGTPEMIETGGIGPIGFLHDFIGRA